MARAARRKRRRTCSDRSGATISRSSSDGGTLVRSPTPGPPLAVRVRLQDRAGAPVAGAEVDVWHSSPEGLYENQDPSQAEMNLRGRFISDAQGRFSFNTVLPAGYPIPDEGPVGELLRSAGRHKFRPAHLHFMVYKPGFKTLISQLYVAGDPASRVGCAIRRHARADRRLRQAQNAAGQDVLFSRSGVHLGTGRSAAPSCAGSGQALGRCLTCEGWNCVAGGTRIARAASALK